MPKEIDTSKYDRAQFVNEDGSPAQLLSQRKPYYILCDDGCYSVLYDTYHTTCNGHNEFIETYEVAVCKTLGAAKRLCRKLIQRDHDEEVAHQANLDRVIQEGLAKLGPDDSIPLEDVIPGLSAGIDMLRASSETRES